MIGVDLQAFEAMADDVAALLGLEEADVMGCDRRTVPRRARFWRRMSGVQKEVTCRAN